MLNGLQMRMKRAIRLDGAVDFDAVAHERLRMYTLFAIAAFKLFNFFGGNWDIQWHLSVGRDNLWIPPHLMVMVAFSGGLFIAWCWILFESHLARSGHQLQHTLRIGQLQASPVFFGVFLGYASALLSGVFDEAWHRAFGIDSTLWSPPHLCIMAATMFVDFNLMIGIANTARRLGARFEWRSPLLWGLALTGAYLFEAVNFQMSQALIESYRANGVGLMGLLFPVLVGAMFPLPLLLSIAIARRFRIALVIFFVAITLQYIGTGIAAIGFAILQPVSIIQEFMRLNPESSVAKVNEYMTSVGFVGSVGIQQAWAMWLSALPLALVALLDRLTWARRRPLIAAPVFSASLVVTTLLWFKQMPVLRDYPTTLSDLFLAILLSAGIGLTLGRVGLGLGKFVSKAERIDSIEV